MIIDTHSGGPPPAPSWKSDLPTPAQLCRQGFGRPDANHSFTQQACADTILFHVLKSGFLGPEDRTALFENTNPLTSHLDTVRLRLQNYDFTWIRSTDTNWQSQQQISNEKVMAMTAALFHYNLDVGLLLRYLGNNYTAAHRDTESVVEKISPLVDPDLVQQYIRVMTVGCPNHFVAESTRDNSVKYWRAGNNPSIAKNLAKVMKTMNKEERNNHVIPLPSWLWRFVPHLHFIPHHLLQKQGKKDRLITDAKFRHDETSVSVNMMTSTPRGVELDCDFGSVMIRLLQRIWNLRISYPMKDIIIHANDVKSCFRQLKHHPDVMGAFSYILGRYLFLQCGLAFGADFSPASWEVIRRIAEQLAHALFKDKSLRAKHRKYLDRLKWHPTLGSRKAKHTPARRCSQNPGVVDKDGVPEDTPHAFYVDDDLYAELFDRERVEQAIAASIEAIFILLGESNLDLCQDPISFEKMEEMMIAFANLVLGRIINTRTMTVQTPLEYIGATVTILKRHWHNKRRKFRIPELETLTGRLGHIGDTAPWLRFMMSHVYTSVASALRASHAHLCTSRQDFRRLLKMAKATALEISFAQSKMAQMVHKTARSFPIVKSLRAELSLIARALSSDWIEMRRPIGHFVRRDPSGTAWSDSSLDAAGGFSLDMGFWWYIEWPRKVRQWTLRYVRDNKSGRLVSINVLEYAALIISYVASTSYFLRNKDPSDPYPVALLWADNTTAEAWVEKACKRSAAGRALGRLQCALMINNDVGINAAHIDTKRNEIADRISRIKRESNAIPEFQHLMQDFPQLRSCSRFHPSAELVSLVMDALLQERSIDPLEASRRVLAGLGKITT